MDIIVDALEALYKANWLWWICSILLNENNLCESVYSDYASFAMIISPFDINLLFLMMKNGVLSNLISAL